MFYHMITYTRRVQIHGFPNVKNHTWKVLQEASPTNEAVYLLNEQNGTIIHVPAGWLKDI